MANAGSARPPDRHVARLGELEEAAVRRRLPVRSDAAARERHQRADLGVVLRPVWRPRRRAHHARSHRFAAVEDLDVNLRRRNSESAESLLHLRQEAGRTAQVDFGLSRKPDAGEDGRRQATGLIEVSPELVSGAGQAVRDITAGARERADQAARLGGEGMVVAIARSVQPQDGTGRPRRRQRVQHRQNRRRADTGAEQNDRRIPGLQDEASARRAHAERVAHADVLSQIGARGAVRLELHADAILLRRWCAGEGVAAIEGLAGDGRAKAQHDVLAGQRNRQRRAVRASHCQ